MRSNSGTTCAEESATASSSPTKKLHFFQKSDAKDRSSIQYLDAPLPSGRYIVFDLETTGLSPWGGDEMIEIGAMKIFGNELDEINVFHSLVNPKRLIPPDATNINGITNEMVQGQPTIDEIFPKFLDFVGSSWLVAQNAKFDMGFITKYLVHYRVKRELEVYDTMIFSRRAFPGENRHNLDVICDRLNIQSNKGERHRSIEDVRLTGLAFLKLKERLGTNLPNRDKYSV